MKGCFSPILSGRHALYGVFTFISRYYAQTIPAVYCLISLPPKTKKIYSRDGFLRSHLHHSQSRKDLTQPLYMSDFFIREILTIENSQTISHGTGQDNFPRVVEDGLLLKHARHFDNSHIYQYDHSFERHITGWSYRLR